MACLACFGVPVSTKLLHSGTNCFISSGNMSAKILIQTLGINNIKETQKQINELVRQIETNC